MRSYVSFAIFLTIFLSLSVCLNSYVVLRLGGLLGVKRRLWVYVLCAALAFCYLAAHIIDSRTGNWFSRAFYVAAAAWMGILLLLFCALLVYEVVHLFVRIPPRPAGVAIVGIVLALTCYSLLNARLLRLRRVVLPAPVDMTIAHLSDIHLGSISPARLQEIVAKTNMLATDMIVITGDLVDNLNRTNRPALAMLNDLEAPVFFVTGNHEGYVGIDMVINELNDTKLRVLRNEAIDFGDVQLVGVDDSFDSDHLAERLGELQLDPERYSILLYHRPECVDAAQRCGIDLMLCGHLHAGQIAPFNLIVWMLYTHGHGLHKIKDMYLNVSAGTGHWGPPMRLGSMSEITLLKLTQTAPR